MGVTYYKFYKFKSKRKTMLARDTKIYKDAQLLTKKIYEVTRTFKTEYRATIARRFEEYSSQLADIIV